MAMCVSQMANGIELGVRAGARYDRGSVALLCMWAVVVRILEPFFASLLGVCAVGDAMNNAPRVLAALRGGGCFMGDL